MEGGSLEPSLQTPELQNVPPWCLQKALKTQTWIVGQNSVMTPAELNESTGVCGGVSSSGVGKLFDW